MTEETLADWLPKLMSIPSSAVNDPLYEWIVPTNRPRLDCLYKRLEKVVDWKSTKTGAAGKKDQARRSLLIGRLYERLLRLLFNGGSVSVVANVRSTSNEIDLLIKIEPAAYVIPFLRKAGTHMIGEAKCHAKAPSSELVNETAGFLPNHQATVGLLFVFCKSRTLKSDVRSAIAMHGARGISVVPVGRKQLQAIRDGAPVMRIITDQSIEAANHLSKLAI